MPADPLSILNTVYGYDSFRGRQRDIIEHVIAGNHAFVLMPTGGGKSLCYQIPALARPGIGLIVSPLIALMEDQVCKLKQRGFAVERIHSGRDRAASGFAGKGDAGWPALWVAWTARP